MFFVKIKTDSVMVLESVSPKGIRKAMGSKKKNPENPYSIRILRESKWRDLNHGLLVPNSRMPFFFRLFPEISANCRFFLFCRLFLPVSVNFEASLNWTFSIFFTFKGAIPGFNRSVAACPQAGKRLMVGVIYKQQNVLVE